MFYENFGLLSNDKVSRDCHRKGKGQVGREEGKGRAKERERDETVLWRTVVEEHLLRYRNAPIFLCGL